jgi:uracil-DNA glycosylase
MSKIKKLIDPSWEKIIIPFFESTEGIKLLSFLQEQSIKKKELFPSSENCLNAFKLTNYNDLKVIILGKAPYSQEKNKANGLAYSYTPPTDNRYIPKSLNRILQEVEFDIYDGLKLPIFKDEKDERDLSRWAEQGVLLLNVALTVEKNNINSHTNEWKPFILHVLKELSVRNSGLIYMIWGDNFKDYVDIINSTSNYVFEAPDPDSENFLGCKHFSKTNEKINILNGKDYKIYW